MSFTIKCDKCGNEQKLEHGLEYYVRQLNIEIYLDSKENEEINVVCRNEKCRENVTIN